MSRPLFDCIDEVAERVALAANLFLCLDFDGTLVASDEVAGLASLPADEQAILQGLSAHPNIALAVISGRELADLEARVGIPGLIYSGNHGMEITGPAFSFVEPTAVESRRALQKLAIDLTARLLPIAGAAVEDKGLTISVHCRDVEPARAEEVRNIVHATLANTSHPFHLTVGNLVFEVRPRVHWTKGDAVAWIRERLPHPDALTIYLGDDPTDEEVFAALHEGITVKVGKEPTAAHYQLDHPSATWRFLAWLDSQAGHPVLHVPAPAS